MKTSWMTPLVLIATLAWAAGALAEGPPDTTGAAPEPGDAAVAAPAPVPADEAVPAPEPAPAEGPPAVQPPDPAPGDGAPAVERADGARDERQRGLPAAEPGLSDGTFGGTLETPSGEVAVRLVVVGGLFVGGDVRLRDGRALELRAGGALDTTHLRLGANDGRDYLQVGVEFFDAERGSGEFSGVLDRQRFGGQWTVERR